MESSGVPIPRIMSSANRDNFTFFPVCFLFLAECLWLKFPEVTLDSKSEHAFPCWIPELSGIFSPFSIASGTYPILP